MRDFSLLPLIKLPCPSLLKTKTTHFAMRHVIFLDLVFSPFNMNINYQSEIRFTKILVSRGDKILNRYTGVLNI